MSIASPFPSATFVRATTPNFSSSRTSEPTSSTATTRRPRRASRSEFRTPLRRIEGGRESVVDGSRQALLMLRSHVHVAQSHTSGGVAHLRHQRSLAGSCHYASAVTRPRILSPRSPLVFRMGIVGTKAADLLPKLRTRVRFSSPAPRRRPFLLRSSVTYGWHA